MSLFQCENCGVVENTACSLQGIKPLDDGDFDFTGIEDRKNKLLCSECAPTKFIDGSSTSLGSWHDQFNKTYLPLGKFKTNNVGNLEHVDTGETDYKKYEIKAERTHQPNHLHRQ